MGGPLCVLYVPHIIIGLRETTRRGSSLKPAVENYYLWESLCIEGDSGQVVNLV